MVQISATKLYLTNEIDHQIAVRFDGLFLLAFSNPIIN
jgi:hypothetical protein